MAPELRFPRRYEYRETQRDVFVRQEKRIWRERWADKKTDPRQTQKAFLESVWDSFEDEQKSAYISEMWDTSEDWIPGGLVCQACRQSGLCDCVFHMKLHMCTACQVGYITNPETGPTTCRRMCRQCAELADEEIPDECNRCRRYNVFSCRRCRLRGLRCTFGRYGPRSCDQCLDAYENGAYLGNCQLLCHLHRNSNSTDIDADCEHCERRQIWDPDLDGLDIETQKQLKDKYIDDFVKSYHGNPDADDQEWRCYAMLGSGGFGIIGLWVAVDESNNVTDRMVVKQVSRRQFEFKGHNGPHHWNDALLWHESPFLRYSHEAHVHRILNMRPSPALVGYRSDVVYKQKEAIRIFLDFCSHGDLWDLNNKYGYYRDQQRISSTNVTLPIRAQYPPEPFLWFLMLKLIDACIALEHIPQELVQKEIVHRDIKFENVYLSAPEPDWPHYPAPKLGDFGLAIFTGPEDNNNPVQYLGPGTPGWMAPEQLGSPYKLEHPQLDQAGNPMRLDARTNVWTIGLLIWAFALGHDSPPEPSIRVRMTMTRNPASDAFRKLYPFDPWPYSIQLQEIIRLCMEFDPADRAGPQEVRDLLQSHMDHAHLFPHQWPDELKAEYQNLGVHLQERYRISTPVSPNRLQGTAEEDDEQPRRRRRGIAEDDEQPRKRRRMARTAY